VTIAAGKYGMVIVTTRKCPKSPYLRHARADRYGVRLTRVSYNTLQYTVSWH